MKCGTCHNEMGNNLTSGAPGAPRVGSWLRSQCCAKDSLVVTFCRSLKDPKNGNRSLEEITTHLKTSEFCTAPRVVWRHGCVVRCRGRAKSGWCCRCRTDSFGRRRFGEGHLGCPAWPRSAKGHVG